MARLIVLLCCCMTVILGCSDSSGPTKDDDDTTKPATVRQTVGSNGGTVENSGMILDIPGGLLAADTEIVLSETIDTSYGDDALTPTYTIEGIPRSFSGTVTIKIKYEGETPDVVGIAVGEEYEDIIGGGTRIFYDLISAHIDNGWITCEISSDFTLEKTSDLIEKTAHSSQDIENLIYWYVKGVKNTSRSKYGRFHVEHHPFWDDFADELCTYLDNAVDTFQQMDFWLFSNKHSLACRDIIYVKIKDVSESYLSFAGYPAKSHEDDVAYVTFQFQFAENRLGTTEEKRKLMKHEAGKVVFTMLEFFSSQRIFGNGEYNYFLRALNEWAGSKIVNDKTFLPDYFKGNEHVAILGLNAGKGKSGNESKTFGKCMSALIRYLDETNGADGSLIKSVLDRMDDSDDEITALLNSASKPVNEWWPEFVQAYLAGDVYPVDTTALFDSPTDTYTIDASSQPEKLFSGSYGDLSAKIYKITLGHRDGDPDRSFTFSAEGQVDTDYLTIMLYQKDSSGNMKLFKKGSDITITSIEDFIAQETDELYAVIVNSACEPPYTKTSNITFIITTGTEPAEAPNMVFVSIPGGSFLMGDEDGDLWSGCVPVHTVTVSDFEMSAMEITNAQYAVYLNEALASGYIEVKSGDAYDKTGDWAGQRYIEIGFEYVNDNKCWISYNDGTYTVASGKENRPVVAVTWFGSKAFALYYGLDLPREAEWEYSARGGRHYKHGTDDGTIDKLKANFNDWPDGHPVDVGSYPANPFGLYDMSGNVWEWCNDWYDDYSSDSAANPTGALTGPYRVFRGGCWLNDDNNCRTADRGKHYPGSRYTDIGFRVVRR